MLTIHVENIGDLAVVECKGRILRSDSVFNLRDITLAQEDSPHHRDGSLRSRNDWGWRPRMLAFLERWARNHHVQFKLFNLSKAVVDGLLGNRSIQNFEIAGFHEMMGILAHSDSRYSVAA